MKVTQVAIRPAEASIRAGRPALTPELLAASGARYSRNNEGLESILSKIDPNNLEKSVDSIFRMVDYGHQSIADMAPAALFIDGISIWLAYHIWSLCPTAGGQESSTRYLKLSLDGLVPAEVLGIPESQAISWRQSMEATFQAYQAVLGCWEEFARDQPALTAIPQSLLIDPRDTAQKKVMRMRRNYAFDRARYFLPAAAATNVMLVMSARAWVNLCQHLLSHPLPEPRRLGELIRGELSLVAPRLIKHAASSDAHRDVIAREFRKLVHLASKDGSPRSGTPASFMAAVPHLDILLPDGVSEEELAGDLAFHANRYAPVGSSLGRIGVRFGWSAIAFAEIRDLNRHRTGTKHCPQVPRGFYCAMDQLPALGSNLEKHRVTIERAAETGHSITSTSARLLRDGEPVYVYWALLGTEFPFEHLTTADKFIYEAELRTGLGAHYRYARHLRDVLALWYRRFPATQRFILEGSAEPE